MKRMLGIAVCLLGLGASVWGSLLSELNGHYYEFIPLALTWHEAKQFAENRGGYLACTTSEQEHDFVAGFVRSSDNPDPWGSYLIGLSDELIEGTFQWVSGEPLEYTKWIPGEPNNQNNEDCVEVGQRGGRPEEEWNDISTDHNTPFVIEYEEFPNLQDGLIAYYPFDGDAKDYSGNGNDGTVMNSPTYPQGRIQQCIRLQGRGHTGTAGDHVLLPSFPFSSYGDFSISIWVNQEGDSSYLHHGEGYIFFGNHAGECLGITNFGGEPYSLGYRIGSRSISVPFNSDWNKWRLYTLVCKGGTLLAYKDGALLGTTTCSVPILQSTAGIGIHWYNSVAMTRFIGSVDDLRIYNRALSSAEIVQLYSQEKHLKDITITGPASVAEGSLTEYTCTAHFTDGSQADVSESAVWSVDWDGIFTSGSGAAWGNTLWAGGANGYPIKLRAEYETPSGDYDTEVFLVDVTPILKASIDITGESYDSHTQIWDVELIASATGDDGGITGYAWDVIGDGTFTLPSIEAAYHVYLYDDSREIFVKVTDAAGNEDIFSRLITAPGAPVAGKSDIKNSFRGVYQSTLFSTSGGDFEFIPSRIDKGLLVIAHGLNDSATSGWAMEMGQAMESRLGADCPNVVLYDWREMADPDKFKGRESNNNNIIEVVFTDAPVIKGYGVAQGDALAAWIKSNMASGNIDPNADIHIVGHSAGGFVAGRCAELRADVITQITMLDTPFPYRGIGKSYLQNGDGLVESYITDFGLHYSSWDSIAGSRSYGVVLYSIASKPSGVKGHSWAHDWYTDNTISGTYPNGFYYSPFMENGFHGYDPGMASAMAMMALAEAEAMTSTMLLTNFSTYGSVDCYDLSYVLHEESDAGIYKAIALPIGAQDISFEYQFTMPGDGDFLSVHWGTNETSFIGLDFPHSRDSAVNGIVSVSEYAGATNILTFNLVSRNATNAVLSISNIVMEVSSDPDGDGLDTDTEISLGTDPLNGDSDGDGLSDGDEVDIYFTDPNLPDSDFDGLTDGQEIQCGTSPTNAMERLEILDFVTTNQAFTLKWSSVGGKQYDIHRSTALPMDSYTTVQSGIYATAPTNTYTDPTATNAVHFYRIQLKE